jgi:hypothetical protein
VIVIKRPDISVHRIDMDHFLVGEAYDMSPALALLMMAAGWVRAQTREHQRRAQPAASVSSSERRQLSNRRVEASH